MKKEVKKRIIDLLDRNIFENFDLSNKCMYDGQYDLALFVCKKIMSKETPYLCLYENELSNFKNIFFQKIRNNV